MTSGGFDRSKVISDIVCYYNSIFNMKTMREKLLHAIYLTSQPCIIISKEHNVYSSEQRIKTTFIKVNGLKLITLICVVFSKLSVNTGYT